MHVMVTGGNGFVGRELCSTLVEKGCKVTAAVRKIEHVDQAKINYISVGDISNQTLWADALQDIDVVVHLAARVHVMHDDALNPLDEFRLVNVAGTEHLARCAADKGIKRIVYISSIKVNGEESVNCNRFSEMDDSLPIDPYGVSKWEAEESLCKIAQETGLEVVIIRPPLIYGEGVKANFYNLIKLCDTNIVLPFGAIENKRSLVYLGNLVDFIALCAEHPKAINETFLISDDCDISTSDLIKGMKQVLGRKNFLISIPKYFLVFMLTLIGKKSVVSRLCGNLQVDTAKAKTLLGWRPPYTFEQGLKTTIDWYLKNKV